MTLTNREQHINQIEKTSKRLACLGGAAGAALGFFIFAEEPMINNPEGESILIFFEAVVFVIAVSAGAGIFGSIGYFLPYLACPPEKNDNTVESNLDSDPYEFVEEQRIRFNSRDDLLIVENNEDGTSSNSLYKSFI